MMHLSRGALDALGLSDEERAALQRTAGQFRTGVTPYYAALANPEDPDDPIRRQFLPRLAELHTAPDEHLDPLAEDRDMPVPGLTHRYPDRVLLYLTHTCAVYCRHCTRRRKVSDPTSYPRAFQSQLDWLAQHPEVHDVVLSGGDPLTLSDGMLSRRLGALRALPHIRLLRIGTRVPVVWPQRITAALASILDEHGPIYIMTHFNHPRECTPQAYAACERLHRAGCVLLNQMVVLRGVNDDVATVRQLNLSLAAMRVRPWRMYHCDYTAGTGQFRTAISKGLAIYEALATHTSGITVPGFYLDLPGGGGKVRVHASDRLQDGRWRFRGLHGDVVLDDAHTAPTL